MSHLSIFTAISPQRISQGQPACEYIKLESLFSGIQGISHTLAETVRFNDYRRNGGRSIRYYHLLDYNQRGIALALDSEGEGRVISGLYENRVIVLDMPEKRTLDITTESGYRAISSQLEGSAVSTVLCQDGGRKLIYTVNCIEFFARHIVISGSARIPTILFERPSCDSLFMSLLDQHSVASDPMFTPIHTSTVDVSLQTLLHGDNDRVVYTTSVSTAKGQLALFEGGTLFIA